jgi:hypothetical protein
MLHPWLIEPFGFSCRMRLAIPHWAFDNYVFHQPHLLQAFLTSSQRAPTSESRRQRDPCRYRVFALRDAVSSRCGSKNHSVWPGAANALRRRGRRLSRTRSETHCRLSESERYVILKVPTCAALQFDCPCSRAKLRSHTGQRITLSACLQSQARAADYRSRDASQAFRVP